MAELVVARPAQLLAAGAVVVVLTREPEGVLKLGVVKVVGEVRPLGAGRRRANLRQSGDEPVWRACGLDWLHHYILVCET